MACWWAAIDILVNSQMADELRSIIAWVDNFVGSVRSGSKYNRIVTAVR